MTRRIVYLFTLLGLFLALTVGCDTSVAPTPPLTVVAIDTPLPTVTAAAVTLPAFTPTTTIVSVATATATQPAVIQEPAGIDRRIQFGAGEISAVVENEVVLGARDRYTLQAQAGQSMRVDITSLEQNAAFAIYGPGGQTIKAEDQGQPVEHWEGRLPTTGDYVIAVGSTRGNATYRLEVTIPPFAAGEPTRIVFEPGMAGTIVRGEIEAGATHRYALSARADQSMFLSVTSPAGDAVLAVEGSNGQVYLSAAERQTQWSSPALPATQDYIVSVVSIGNRTNYTLDVGISALASLPTRIQFAPGTTSATISGTLAAGGAADYYILGAAAGQRIMIETATTAAPLFVWLQGEDGASYFAADDSGGLVAQLPSTQDYILTVAIPNAAGQTEYSLTVTIE